MNWATSTPNSHSNQSGGHHGGHNSNNNNHSHRERYNNNSRDHHGGAKPGANGLYNVFVGDLDPTVDEAALKSAFAAYATLEEAKVMVDAEGASRGFGFVMFKEVADAQNAIAEMQGRPLSGRNLRLNWAHPPMSSRGEGREGREGRYGGNNSNHNSSSGGHFERDGSSGPRKSHHAQPYPPAPLDYNEVLNASHPANVTVYVGNLSPEVTSAKLQELFSPYGEIAEVRDHADTRNTSSASAAAAAAAAASADGAAVEAQPTPTYRGYGFILFKTHESAARAIVGLNGTLLHGKMIKCSWGSEKRPISNTSGAPLPGFPYGPTAFNGYSNPMYFYHPFVQGMQGSSLPSGPALSQGNFNVWYPPPTWPPQNPTMVPHMPMSFPPAGLSAPSQTAPSALGGAPLLAGAPMPSNGAAPSAAPAPFSP